MDVAVSTVNAVPEVEVAGDVAGEATRRPSFEGDDIDVELIRAAQAGDLPAFSSLYDRHHERLVRFCRSRLGDADDAADAAQETFLRAWRALDTFGNRGNVYPWLHAIARNVCTDTLRKRLRVEPSDDQTLGSLPDTGLSVSDLVDAEADTVLLRTAFDRLSDRHREILAMREYRGWTYERIADEEKLELNAVKSLLWRARQSLRREFLSLTEDGRAAVD
jgi:RNA polymerase sigma-70 factor (ECF subfamily)